MKNLFENLDDCGLFYEFNHNYRMEILETLITNAFYILSSEISEDEKNRPLI